MNDSFFSEEDILIVDDNTKNLKLLVDILKKAGYSVRPANDGELALRTIKVKLPMLILLDIRMPNMDGYAVCQQLKASKKTRHIPVIFISAISDPLDKVKAFNVGGIDYITKPFSPEEVLARVKTHLCIRTMQNQLEAQNLALREASELLEKRVQERTQALKNAYAALSESREQLHRMFEEGPIGMVVCTADLRFADVNTAFCQMLGYEKSELIGRTVSSISHPTDIGKSERLIEQTLKERKPFFQVEKRYIRKDGEVIWGHVATSFFRDSQGNVTHFLSKFEDITQRKQAETALKKAKEAADAANRAKSEFLANMSHEIRTPMNAIIGFSDLLRTLISDKKQKSYLDTIRISGKTLLTLINDILDLSKIEAGRLEIQYESTDVYVLFKEIEQIFLLKVHEKGLDFFLEIDRNLPSGLILDEIRLRQILINLLSNAIKFTKQGYIKLSVHRAAKKGQGKIDLMMTVEDTGIGIPEQQQLRIFESFTQVQGQSTRKYGGTGLGLAISKRLVELMNGDITVYSTLGKGSVFEIILHDVELSVIETREYKKQDIDLERIVFEKATVLVVDDIESNRNLIRECLNQVNLGVIEAQNGKDSLLFVKAHQPDLILMDLKMPVMDGYMATKILKNSENTKNIPVVALTASATFEEKRKIQSSSFDGSLYKPVDIIELLEELSHHLPHSIKESPNATEESTQSETALSAEEWAKLPTLLEILENEMLPQSQELSDLMEIDSIEKFAKRTIELGEFYHVKLLTHYGTDLAEFTENFELDDIAQSLIDFKKIIKKITKIKDTLISVN